MKRLGTAALMALVLTCSVSPGAGAAAASSKAHSCDPPSGTFYTSMRVEGVRCRQARRVLTRGECDNESCSRFSYRGWHCRVKGGIRQRTTRCRHGDNRIVAQASGDKATTRA